MLHHVSICDFTKIVYDWGMPEALDIHVFLLDTHLLSKKSMTQRGFLLPLIGVL